MAWDLSWPKPLVGCLKTISQVLPLPSGSVNLTSLAMMSISSASGPGRRVERTPRMLGVIPLVFFARLVVCVYINVSVLGGARLPRDNNDGNTILLAPNVELFKSRIKLDV